MVLNVSFVFVISVFLATFRLIISCFPAAGGTENGEDDSKKATEEELSFIKSSICEQWKKLGVRIHKKLLEGIYSCGDGTRWFSNPPPCRYMDLCLVIQNSSPPCFVNSELICLLA